MLFSAKCIRTQEMIVSVQQKQNSTESSSVLSMAKIFRSPVKLYETQGDCHQHFIVMCPKDCANYRTAFVKLA